MEWICFTAALLACGLTLGNALAASWAAAKTEQRFDRLEAAIQRLERQADADPYVYTLRDLE